MWFFKMPNNTAYLIEFVFSLVIYLLPWVKEEKIHTLTVKCSTRRDSQIDRTFKGKTHGKT